MRAGIAFIIGGIALIAGALLPWMSLFLRLWPLRGVTGVNGYVFIVGGVLAIAGGVALGLRRLPHVRRIVGALGLGLLTFAAWLMIRVDMAVRHIAVHDPMMLPRIGPGLFVVMLGALTVGVVGLLAPRAAVTPVRGPGCNATIESRDQLVATRPFARQRFQV